MIASVQLTVCVLAEVCVMHMNQIIYNFFLFHMQCLTNYAELLRSGD